MELDTRKREIRYDILNILRTSGPLSREQLISASQFGRSATETQLSCLLGEGIVQATAAPEPLSRGRKKSQLDIQYGNRFVFGVAMHRAGASLGVCTLDQRILARRQVDFPADADLIERCAQLRRTALQMLQENLIDARKLIGVGIALSSDVKKMIGNSFDEMVRRFTALPFVCIGLGNGIGYANHFLSTDGKMNGRTVVLSDMPVQGFVSALFDGERFLGDRMQENTGFGQILLEAPYQGNGTLNDFAGQSAVIEKLRCLFSEQETPQLYDLCGGCAEQIPRVLEERVSDFTDPPVLKVMQQVIGMIGLAVHNTYKLLHPDRIILQNYYYPKACFGHFIRRPICALTGGSYENILLPGEIDDKNLFLSACVPAVLSLFFGM